MIVCQCTGKTDRHIRKAVEGGARSATEVMRACDAGGCCGGCTPLIEQLVRLSSRPGATMKHTPRG